MTQAELRVLVEQEKATQQKRPQHAPRAEQLTKPALASNAAGTPSAVPLRCPARAEGSEPARPQRFCSSKYWRQAWRERRENKRTEPDSQVEALLAWAEFKIAQARRRLAE